jgi:hypothetical protein
MNDFEKFNISLKLFNDAKDFNSLEEYALSFDSKILELENVLDSDAILMELNTVARKTFKFGAIFESQQRTLQKLEDSFDLWYNKKYFEVYNANPSLKTEKAREMLVMINNEEEYTKYIDDINNEKYKLGLLKRVCNSLDNYSIKLHTIFKYRVENQKGDNQPKR